MNSQIGCFPVPKWSLLQYRSDKNALIAREKNKNVTKLLFMSKASHYPTFNIHVEACSTSEMDYYKRLSRVREQEKHGAHFYGIYMYRKSLDWALSETCSILGMFVPSLKQHFILKGVSSPAQGREFLGIFLY